MKLKLLLSSIVTCTLLAVTKQPSNAQILGDETLPINSNINQQGNSFVIEGGTTSGGNLFHSFQEFSVPIGTEAFFNNALTIDHIISRVTGGQISNIDGLIRANGKANLFFINPNGIVFGENARLELGGSFLGTTAESVIFAEGGFFSASEANAPPLLTISVPIGLQLGQNPGAIEIAGTDGIGLAVKPGNTLALLGGDVTLTGGTITASSGRIEMGSVAQASVSLTPTAAGFALGYEGVDKFQDIQLFQNSAINASGEGGGEIQLQGRQVLVSGGSQVLTITEGSQPGGNLRVNATELVAVSGTSADGQLLSSLQADTIGAGAGGDLIIATEQLQVQDRALVSATTFGEGRGGDLTISASESVELSGSGFENLQRNILSSGISGELEISDAESGLLAAAAGTGSAGKLTIDTTRLTLQDGALVSTTTGGTGAGGNIVVRASESMEITGSLFVTGTLQRTTGAAGNLNVDTKQLIVQDGGLLQAFTFGQGAGGNLLVNASESVELLRTPAGALVPAGIFANSLFGTGAGGNIEVNTQRMIMQGGAQVGTQTGSLVGTEIIPLGGPAGDIVLNVSDFIEISGLSPDGRFGSGPGSSSFSDSPAGDVSVSSRNLTIGGGANISTTTFSAGQGGILTVNVSETLELIGTGITNRQGVPVEVPTSLVSSSGRADFPNLQASGDAGIFRVNAGELIIRDGAAIAVNSLGSGNAGRLEVVADSLRLDNGATLNAATARGEGGDITLQTQELLLLGGSKITTNAGNTDGGNIIIDTNTLTALENSDITANAQQGRGGRVSITAQGIFGTEFREQLTPESDITATSELGVEFYGIVELNTPEIDPSAGLVELPTDITDQSSQIAAACPADKGNTFVVTGQGGLPLNPTQTLPTQQAWQDWRFLDDRENNPSPVVQLQQPNAEVRLPLQQITIVEATSWIVNNSGQVELIAQVPNSTVKGSWHQPAGCRDF
ncbi:MAG: S-layer family protein [Symploca sp. SIO3C6]|nr:S-layer family protein [Symploca sp. SIO3C6]